MIAELPSCRVGAGIAPRPERLPGWEDRLFATIEAACSRPYKLGEHDCFRLACAVIEALTGVNPWEPWAGSYASKREALRRIAEFAGDFTSAASKFFGSEPECMELARRGDICEFVDVDGEQHLGVMLGLYVALLGPDGLSFAPREACKHFWKIG